MAASFVIHFIFLSCAQKKTTISAAISIKKDSTTIVIKDSTGIKPIYINGSLDSFLRKISTIDSPITGIKIYFIKTNGNAPASKTFQYINCEDTISLIESYDRKNNTYVSKNLFLNEENIKKYFLLAGHSSTADNKDLGFGGYIMSIKDLDFGNDVNSDSFPAKLYITPLGEFILLSANTPDLNVADANFSTLDYNFLLPLHTKKIKGIYFNSFHVPGYLYVGYEKKTNKLMYLDIPPNFSPPEEDDSIVNQDEFEYTITAKYLDLATYNVQQIKDSTGKEYFMKIATPDNMNDSTYRIIKSYWWPYNN